MMTTVEENSLPSGSSANGTMTTRITTLLQLNKDSLDVITRGVLQGLLQTEKGRSTPPPCDRTVYIYIYIYIYNIYSYILT